MDSRFAQLSEIPVWAGVLLTVADAFHLPWLSGGVWCFVIGSSIIRRLATGRRLRSRHLRRQVPSEGIEDGARAPRRDAQP